MSVYESIRVALQGLAANKLRSSLTMLGIVIGVGAVIALLALGEGTQAAITEEIQSIGSNLIFIMPGRMEAEGHGPMTTKVTADTLTLADAEAIAGSDNPSTSPGHRVPGVLAVAPEFSNSADVAYGNESIKTTVKGTTSDYPSVRSSFPERGEFFTEQHNNTMARVAVLGHQTAEDLFGGSDPLGRTIKINSSTDPSAGGSTGSPRSSGQSRIHFRVIGVMEEKGGGMGGNQDDAVFIPITTAQRKLFGGRTTSGTSWKVSTISVALVSEETMDTATDEITVLLRQRHKIRPGDDDDFTVISQEDVLSMAEQITGILTIFLGAIAAISLLVGGIGIMNIMLVSVTERTREIGIRKAVGAKRRDILMQFLIEAVVLSVIGGLLGILLGAGIAVLVEQSGLMTTVISTESILLATGFSVAVGLFFGIYPSMRAARLHPIEALRYE
jgi:putative ABC transport system permease protein